MNATFRPNAMGNCKQSIISEPPFALGIKETYNLIPVQYLFTIRMKKTGQD
jgi:hypothetical protein